MRLLSERKARKLVMRSFEELLTDKATIAPDKHEGLVEALVALKENQLAHDAAFRLNLNSELVDGLIKAYRKQRRSAK